MNGNHIINQTARAASLSEQLCYLGSSSIKYIFPGLLLKLPVTQASDTNQLSLGKLPSEAPPDLFPLLEKCNGLQLQVTQP